MTDLTIAELDAIIADGVTIEGLRAEIMRIMREEFDPTPSGFEGRGWDDNAEDTADRIIKVARCDPDTVRQMAEMARHAAVIMKMLKERPTAPHPIDAVNRLKAALGEDEIAELREANAALVEALRLSRRRWATEGVKWMVEEIDAALAKAGVKS
jgi:hypothetical protein